MRTLLVAAAAILSVTAARAQDTTDRALPAATPSAQLIQQLKAAGELKDPKALEAPAPKLDSIETNASTKPAEPAPAAAPASTAVAPAAAPATTTTAAKPTEVKPAEAKPVQLATEAKPAKKRVARRSETREQRARRIAAKYGVYW